MSMEEKVNLTPQRRAVLAVVHESREHLTARDILERARHIEPRLSYATVYNALGYLTRAGMIHELCLANAASRYDRRELSHGHAVCEGCGRILDLDLPDLTSMVRDAAAADGFEAASASVVVRGRCADCVQEGPDGARR